MVHSTRTQTKPHQHGSLLRLWQAWQAWQAGFRMPTILLTFHPLTNKMIPLTIPL